MDTAAGALGLAPGTPLRGAARTPGSKSIAQRALVCAALADGSTHILGLPHGDDVRAALELVSALTRVARSEPGDGVAIEGRPPAGVGLSAPPSVAVGESGTLARLATAVLALGATPGQRLSIEASGTLLHRSSPPLFDALRLAGVTVAGSSWPLVVEPVAAPPQARLIAPVSSQEVSALLLALGAWPGERSLEVEGRIPSRPYVDLTLAVGRRFGLHTRVEAREGGEVFHVRGPLEAPSIPLEVEPDASLAAVALAAGCLSGGEVSVPGLGAGSPQGDLRIVELLRAFGCQAIAAEGELRAGGRPVRPATVDLVGEPDLAPVLAVVAAAAAASVPADRAWSELRGLGTLPGKESSRIEVLARGLDACGWSVEASSDRLRVGPPHAELCATHLIDPAGDHRMAFAFALLGLVRAGVYVKAPACVAKSWPAFWSDLGDLGAQVRAQ